MKKFPIYLLTLLVLLFLVACSGATNEKDPIAENTTMTEVENNAMMADETMNDANMGNEVMDDEAIDNEAMSDEVMSNEAMSDAAAWQNIALTNVRTGETFTLADFAGKTVFVEPMATWCTNCRRQLSNVSAARAQFGVDVVFVGLSVETTISNDDLKAYTDSTGFDWVFAVATPELLQELVALYGQTITNPPSTPHFIIRPDGSTTDLVTGIEGVEEIVTQIQNAQG
jgi:thiol-disulfide isomerase/thioredoxin